MLNSQHSANRAWGCRFRSTLQPKIRTDRIHERSQVFLYQILSIRAVDHLELEFLGGTIGEERIKCGF